MNTSDYIATASLFIALVAFIISILDWLQIGREEPWSVEWASDGALILRRLHYWPVWIEALHNFHGGKVQVLNDAAHMPWPVRRNSQQLLRVTPVIEGTFVTICYRRLNILELLQVKFTNFIDYIPRKPLGKVDYQARKIQKKTMIKTNKYWNKAELRGKREWSTPVIKK